MKIVCDACSAKYSIADEKVRGKVFKIRCKKCSNIIVVRGNAEADGGAAGAADPGEAPAADGGDPDAVWHLVIDQQQVGPMTPDEVRGRLDRGEIDAESYIWREGFGDWERMADVEPFSAWFSGTAASNNLFGGASDDSRTVQADPGDLFSSRAAEPDPGADLFSGAGGDAGLFGGGAPAAAAAAPAATSGAELKGQRSENSVLFSLNNLAALASDSPRVPAASAPVSAGGMAQHGGGEGSGLIDIRSMAQVYLGNESKPSASTPAGSIDDLPVFSPSSFDAASPVLLPTASASNNNKLIFALAGLIGVLIIAAAILVIVVVKGGNKPAPGGETVASASPTEPSRKAPATPGEPSGTPAATPSEPSGTPAATPSEPSGTPSGTPAATPTERKPSTPTERKPDRTPSTERKPDRTPTPTPPPKPVASPVPDDGGGCDEVACLVEPDKACCKKRRSGGSSSKPAPSASSDLPEKPGRSDITSGIGAVRGRVQACGSKTGGTGSVSAKIKISPGGGVDSVSASGGSGPLNACVESALRGARFTKSQKGVTVNYPFVFR